ncbi:hypothetical protein Bca101_045869 [Brassica carinata]
MTTVASGFVSFSPALNLVRQSTMVQRISILHNLFPLTIFRIQYIFFRPNLDASTTTSLYSSMVSSKPISEALHNVSLADLDPGTAKLAIGILGPALSAFGFLFILRIVMSWYPKLPVEKFPYVLAYAPTEPILVQTRKVIPPLAGVDVTPVVWFGLLSFLSEILVGPQGLLVLVSQQQIS